MENQHAQNWQQCMHPFGLELISATLFCMLRCKHCCVVADQGKAAFSKHFGLERAWHLRMHIFHAVQGHCVTAVSFAAKTEHHHLLVLGAVSRHSCTIHLLELKVKTEVYIIVGLNRKIVFGSVCVCVCVCMCVCFEQDFP